MAYFNRSITPYILYIALYKNCVYKGFGVSYSYWKTYFWNPFDDSSGLHDSNATEKKTPGSCLIASFDQNITPYILYIALNPF